MVASVASGELAIGPTQQSNFVAVSYDDAHSILFSSLREREPSPEYGGVYCTLETIAGSGSGSGSAGSGSASSGSDADVEGVFCRRTAQGTDSGLGTVTVRWTVVTFSSGVIVQRGLLATTTPTPDQVALGSAVDASTSFVLLNGTFAGGTGWGNNELMRAQLVVSDGSATAVAIGGNAATGTTTWQVVTMAEASVQSGSAALGSADLTATATVGSASLDSLVLDSYNTDNASGISASALMVQATLTDTTTLTFTRNAAGSGSAAVSIAWQVVGLPFFTKTMTTNFGSGDMMEMVSVTGLAGSSSVALASGQAAFGQSGGSTTYQGSGSTADLLGEAAAELTVSDGQVMLQRASSDATASFTWTAIDFGSNRCQ